MSLKGQGRAGYSLFRSLRSTVPAPCWRRPVAVSRTVSAARPPLWTCYAMWASSSVDSTPASGTSPSVSRLQATVAVPRHCARTPSHRLLGMTGRWGSGCHRWPPTESPARWSHGRDGRRHCRAWSRRRAGQEAACVKLLPYWPEVIAQVSSDAVP